MQSSNRVIKVSYGTLQSIKTVIQVTHCTLQFSKREIQITHGHFIINQLFCKEILKIDSKPFG